MAHVTADRATNDTVYYCAFDTANGGWETRVS